MVVCPTPASPTGRELLLGEIDGYAAEVGTTGAGTDGPVYVVTSTEDAGAGSLREGLEMGGQWVVFDPAVFPVDVETTISLNSAIHVASDTTLDGRCANVRLTPTSRADGALFVGRFGESGVENVVLHNVRIGPIPGRGGEQSGDGIRIVWGSDRFYVSHVDVVAANDEALEITRGDQGPMRGTIAYSRFTDTTKAILIGDQTNNVEKQGGWSPGQHRIHVTMHHNWMHSNGIRNPLVTDSTAHLYNNYVSAYGIDGNERGSAGQEFGGEAWVWTEGNVIEPPEDGALCGIKVVDYGSLGVTGTTHITAQSNVFRSGSHFCSFRESDPTVPRSVPYSYDLTEPGDDGAALVDLLTNDPTNRAGWVAAS